MKILFLITSLHKGGAERVLSNMSLNFPEEVECTALLNERHKDDYPFKGEIRTIGIKEDFKMNLWFQIKVFLKRYIMLCKMKKNGKYQSCISFMESSNFANILSGKKYCKVIVTVHISYQDINSRIYKWIVVPTAAKLYKRADAIVTVSEGIKDELIRNLHIDKNKIHVIYNAFNVQQLAECAEMPIENQKIRDFIKDSFVYVNMGRLEHQKGQWHLIRVFAEVIKKCPDVKLIIMGEGKYRDYFENLIQMYSLQESILLLHFQQNPYQILHACSAYVMPSLFEGYPNALCEALICELPCIATDFRTGAREILAPDTDFTYQNRQNIEYAKYGILTPVCSEKHYNAINALEQEEELLMRAMLKLRQDSVLYNKYKKTAMERAKQLDIQPIMHEWMQLIEAPSIGE